MAEAEPQTTSTTDSRSYLQKLRAGEQHWPWKFSFRVAICILDIVGIGCAAWLVAQSYDQPDGLLDIFYFDYFMLPGSLTVLAVSFMWCLIVILIYLLRRPPSPIHPGFCVGIDLVLWLALIAIGLFTIGAVVNIATYGSDPTYLEDPSNYNSNYDGHYILKPNGTWVYKITYVRDPCDYDYTAKGCHYNPNTGTYTSNRTIASVHRNCEPYFSNCAQQDAYINKLWQEKPLIEGTEIVVAAAQWLGVLFHFILFLWACVDTHRYNARTKRRYTQVDAQEIAQRVIADMEAKGLITVHGTAAARAEGMEMSQMSRPVAGPSREMPVVAGPSRESEGSMEIGQAR